MAATAASGLTTTAGSLEGVPTATTRYSIGIINGKPGTHQAVNIVHFAASNIAQAHFVNEDLKVVLLNNGIAFLLLIEKLLSAS